MKRTLYTFGLGCLFLVNTSMAADIPNVVEGSQQYDKQNCIQSYTDNCINHVCVHSEQIDCESNCRTLAQDKCAN